MRDRKRQIEGERDRQTERELVWERKREINRMLDINEKFY